MQYNGIELLINSSFNLFWTFYCRLSYSFSSRAALEEFLSSCIPIVCEAWIICSSSHFLPLAVNYQNPASNVMYQCMYSLCIYVCKYVCVCDFQLVMVYDDDHAIIIIMTCNII